MEGSVKRPSLLASLVPVVFLVFFLWLNVSVFGDASLDGSNQVILILAAAVAALIAQFYGVKWRELQGSILKNINSAMPSMLILLLIGALSGTWMVAGIVPAMIYYGLQVLNPSIILLAACVICALVSLATGSSWTTVATVGIALMGIGKALDISEGMVAGAIISGAYFGDKMSPLSDTTNLAPAMAGTDLFTHIRYMMLTTIPSLIITLLIFLFIGLGFDAQGEIVQVQGINEALLSTFNINPVLFLAPALVLFLIVKRAPAIPALLAGILLASVFAIIFQPDILRSIAPGEDETFLSSLYKASMVAIYGSVNVVTHNPLVDELLSTGGMAGMLGTIWLILSAMIFGGVMDGAGMLQTITSHIIKLARSTGSLVGSTAITCGFLNITASDQYLAIVVSGKMFQKVYKDRGLAPQNLSRTLEDSGTVTSVLVPWNTCGATQSRVLMVDTITYLPYCFFNIISPLMTIFFAYAGIKIAKLKTKHQNNLEDD